MQLVNKIAVDQIQTSDIWWPTVPQALSMDNGLICSLSMRIIFMYFKYLLKLTFTKHFWNDE